MFHETIPLSSDAYKNTITRRVYYMHVGTALEFFSMGCGMGQISFVHGLGFFSETTVIIQINN